MKNDTDCTVNDINKHEDRAKQIAIHLAMNPERQDARKNSYSFEKSVQKSDLPRPLNNARRLAANYASPSSARLALMTYRRQDSFITTPARW